MTTWMQASGNPFGPPDDDGDVDVGLGAAFGAVDSAPADARFGTHNAFATAPSYDQMFGGADATPLVPSETVGAPHPAPAMPPPPPTAEPAPPPPLRVTHPPPALERFAEAAAFPFGAASVSSEDAFASIGEVNTIRPASTTTHERAPPNETEGSPAMPRTSPSPEAPSPPRTRAAVGLDSGSITPRSPQSPRATVFVPAPAEPGPEEEDEKRKSALFVHGSAHERIASSRDDDDDDDDVNEELPGGFRLARRPNENETGNDDPTDPADSSVEALASAAATAASSARRLEARVQELEAELEAYRLGADDAARALAEKEATTSASSSAESERITSDSNARLLDRLEKATRALDRERLALKKAEALAVAATRRAAEAESASRETLTRAETLERLNVEAEARAECLANDLRDLRNRAAAEATERLRNSRDVLQDVPKTSSCHEDDAKKSSVMVEVRVAPDADELLAREAAASRLKAEAEAISSASARLVEKLVRENGALVERLERMQSYDASTHETSLDTRVTNTAYSSRETSPGTLEARGNLSTSRETKTSSAKKNDFSEDEPEEPPRPRGLWAFITGADRAPAKYVPRRAADAK